MSTVYCNVRFKRRSYKELADALVEADEGGTVILGPKGADLPNGVTINLSTTITGDEKGSPISTGERSPGIFVDGRARPVDVTLRHLDLSTAANANAIVCKGAVNLTLEDCTFGWNERVRKASDGASDRWVLLNLDMVTELAMRNCVIGGGSIITAQHAVIDGCRLGRPAMPVSKHVPRICVEAARLEARGGQWAHAQVHAATGGTITDVATGGDLVLGGRLEVNTLSVSGAKDTGPKADDTEGAPDDWANSPYVTVSTAVGDTLTMHGCSLTGDPGPRAAMGIRSDGTVVLDGCTIGATGGTGLITGKGIVRITGCRDLAQWAFGEPRPQLSARDSHGSLAAMAAEKAPSQQRTTGALEKIMGMTGLRSVKERLNGVMASARANKARASRGMVTTDQNLNMLFLGPPGTGKTTVARLMSRALYDAGAISKDIFVTKSVGALKGTHVGEAARNMESACRSAVGGVLLLDEAYALESDDVYTPELVNTLLVWTDDSHRGDLIVILAGYTEPTLHMVDTVNAGMGRRFPIRVNFESYSPDELVTIGTGMLRDSGYVFARGADGDFAAWCAGTVPRLNKDPAFGNAGWMRNVIDRLITAQNLRLNAMQSATDDQLATIEPADVRSMAGAVQPGEMT